MDRIDETRLTLKETTSGHHISELKRDLSVGSPDPPHAVGDFAAKLLPHSCVSERADSANQIAVKSQHAAHRSPPASTTTTLRHRTGAVPAKGRTTGELIDRLIDRANRQVHHRHPPTTTSHINQPRVDARRRMPRATGS